MTGRPPALHELRAEAARLGVSPTDDDLERVRTFLEVILPAITELERLVPGEAPPAGLFRPEEEP
jgi:hypothetical protein